MAFWTVASSYSPNLGGDSVTLPNRGVEHYLTFKDPELAEKYKGENKIPMETFHELYFDQRLTSMVMLLTFLKKDMTGLLLDLLCLYSSSFDRYDA